MSILMDALKQQQPAQPISVPSPFWRNIALVLGVLLAIALGFGAGYLWLPERQPTPSEITATPVPAVPASAADIANVLVSANLPPVRALTEPVAEPIVKEVLAPEPPMVTVTTNTARAEPEPEVSTELRERFASALAQSTDGASRSVASVTTHNAPAQDIGTLDVTIQRQLPKLRFEAHVYATQPAQRWVKVNGKSLQEGQWITADVRLREITPQYVLLEFGQQLFSMRALSEW